VKFNPAWQQVRSLSLNIRAFSFNIMATTWQQHGNNMATTWQQHGNNMATTWQQHGNLDAQPSQLG